MVLEQRQIGCVSLGGLTGPSESPSTRSKTEIQFIAYDLFYHFLDSGALQPSLYPFFTFLATCLRVLILPVP